MTLLMTSPRVVGFPSLPAVERSTAGMVKESETWCCLEAVALIRGAPAALHAEGGLVVVGAAEGAREGKASTESVLSWPLEEGAGAAGAGSFVGGKGSGAPSSSCFLWIWEKGSERGDTPRGRKKLPGGLQQLKRSFRL